ncbi:hypothetical protein KEN51_CDS0177 [Pseudomonas phage vB_Pae10145-KEN51]|uniref:AAA+ ATPase domain-containing protein n=3 Tax=root TaxID=1 RepID=A0AAE7S8Q6_9CAUD|nr:AAA family ATPase [Pseudomonas aeruginosa]QGK89880.1 hypothetical protein [Pseudomonas phage vB_PA32_GUMS]QOV08098.1 hypothetical protein [Pseudomonas phage vB_PaeM_kmuB]QXN68471.1 hypothetical protein [Pseudomonas phage PA7]QYV99099.1 hypothetical protein [Pseudomonas phage T2P]QYV99406.1 hypothetical protein [Pseudomonas phage U1B]QYV99862.1 hypothetical protein [Pseudomonas phage U5]UNI71629.1 AAA family ATPase [Pseudomonas phage Churi01]UXD83226.1 hypothetical protein NP274_00174 [Ps
MNYRNSKLTLVQQKWIDRFISIAMEVDNGRAISNAYRYTLNEQGISSDSEDLRIHYPFGVDRKEFIKEQIYKLCDEVISPLNLKAFRISGGFALLDDEGIIGFLMNGMEGTTSQNFRLYSNEELIKVFKLRFEEVFDQTRPPSIKRIRVNYQNNELYSFSEVISVRNYNPNMMEMYPFLDRSPAEIWTEFAASESNVLLLIGPPGTGKSNYINEIIRARGYNDRNVYLADQDDVLGHAGLTNFIRGVEDNSLIITEDSDKMVAKRVDGNSNMSGLLNATAGLVSTKTKIIISTNLPTLRDVDEALVRPGRAFDILTFKTLTAEQANAARLANGLDPVEFVGNNLTLAEALNTSSCSSPRKASRVGF